MKKVIIYLTIILISLTIGAISGNEYRLKKNSSMSVVNEYNRGWEECQSRYKRLTNSQPYEAEVEIKFLSGKIVKNDINTINVDIIKFDYSSDPNLDIRIIKIGQNTPVYKVVKKDDEEYKTELEAYNSNLQNDQEQPPSDFKEISINNNELKIGQNVQIWTEQNVRNIKEFTASKILVEYQF